MNSIVVAVTGASGAPYARHLVEVLVRADMTVELVLSRPARRVAREELQVAYDAKDLANWLGDRAGQVRMHDPADIGASIASGSYPVRGMAVVPCSMGTAGRIAAGLSQSLIERAADVQLKQRRRLILAIRETPLSSIHLENLLRLSQAGAMVMPLAPGFYARPSSVQDLVRFMVERVLDAFEIPHDASVRWSGESPS